MRPRLLVAYRSARIDARRPGPPPRRRQGGRRRRCQADARAGPRSRAAWPPRDGRLPRPPAGQRVRLRRRPARDPRPCARASRRCPRTLAALARRYWLDMPKVARLVPADADVVNAHEWLALRPGRAAARRLSVPARVDAKRRVGVGARDRPRADDRRRHALAPPRVPGCCRPGPTSSMRGGPTRSWCSARSRPTWFAAATARTRSSSASGRRTSSSTPRSRRRRGPAWDPGRRLPGPRLRDPGAAPELRGARRGHGAARRRPVDPRADRRLRSRRPGRTRIACRR